MMYTQRELPIIQRTCDLILWYVPALNRSYRDFKLSNARGNEHVSGLINVVRTDPGAWIK